MIIEPGTRFQRLGSASGHEADGSLRVTAVDGALIVLNPTAAALWELLDGQTTVDEVVTAATALFAGSPQTIRDDIFSTLEELGSRSLLARSQP
jgi:hypothetical protein